MKTEEVYQFTENYSFLGSPHTSCMLTIFEHQYVIQLLEIESKCEQNSQ